MPNEAEIAKKCLEILKQALELCEGSGPCYEALEECRYTLTDISESR